MSTKTDLMQLRRKAIKLGWSVPQTQKNHYAWIPPGADKAIIVSSGTPSDHRALPNLRAYLRRAGLPRSI